MSEATAYLISPAILFDISLIFLFALAGVLSPLYLRHHAIANPGTIGTVFNHGNAFSAGVLLSAAFVHLLPEADKTIVHALPSLSFPLAQALAVLGAVLIFVTDRVLRQHFEHSQKDDWAAPFVHQHGIRNFTLIGKSPSLNHDHHSDILSPSEYQPLLSKKPSLGKTPLSSLSPAPPVTLIGYLLLAILSFHSLMEGLALGSTLGTSTKVYGLLFAILSHKFLAAFALGASLITKQPDVSYYRMTCIAFSFASVTPIGAIMGYMTTRMLSRGSLSDALCGALMAISAGVFTYLAFELLEESFSDEHREECAKDVESLHVVPEKKGGDTTYRIASFVVGATIMTVLAIWV